LFAASADARAVVAVIGGATALMAAIVAVTQTDLKRILAYSTISQLGYMFLGMGTGTLLGIAAGMFHLVTHAFFKALLFLGAGSVMHATGGEIDIRRLGGLRRAMPVTCATFLVGALGLAGIVPLAGFWSKDAILAAVRQRSTAGAGSALFAALYLAALFTALLTAFYSFRAFFVTFYGPTRMPPEAAHHAHESPRVMTVPLVLLAVGTVVVGALLEWNGVLEKFLAQTPSISFLEAAAHAADPEAGFDWAVAGLSTLVAVVGIALAGALYLAAPGLLGQLTSAMKAVGLYGLSAGKFFFDQVYGLAIVRPLEGVARLSAWADRVVIDGLVDWVGGLPPGLGSWLRPFQGGLVPFYALAMLLGLLVLLGTILI
jgi:NADH-quinone oxidoreductase subunit L